MTKWNPIRTVPRGKPVKLKTVSGIVCLGKVMKGVRPRPADRYGPRRINAKRLDLEVTPQGDIRAVAWR